MGLDTISIGGEIISYFNVLEEITYLRDVFFNFISGWASAFALIIVLIWVMVFVVVLTRTFRKRFVDGI